MRKNIAKVLAGFEAGKAANGDAKRTCSTDGHAIYSYDLKIAWRDDTGAIHVISREEALEQNPRGWSMTTRSQIRACEFHFAYNAPVMVAARERLAAERAEREGVAA